jgi:hypothetical protein
VALRKEQPRAELEAKDPEQYQLFETSQYKYRVFVSDMSDPIYLFSHEIHSFLNSDWLVQAPAAEAGRMTTLFSLVVETGEWRLYFSVASVSAGSPSEITMRCGCVARRIRAEKFALSAMMTCEEDGQSIKTLYVNVGPLLFLGITGD